MFRETSPVPYCMAQEFAMLYDTLITMAHTGAQLSGSGAQLSGSGAQLSGSGAQLSAISAYLRTYVISRGAVVRQPIYLELPQSSHQILLHTD